MPLPSPQPFSTQGRSLEVRAIPQTDRWEVRVFEGKRPATAVTYSIDYLTELGARAQGIDWVSVQALMGLAREDIETGRVLLLPENSN